MRIEPKPWGREEIVFEDGKVVKLLYLDKNKSTSLHFHKKKTEKMGALKGTGYIYINDERKVIGVNDHGVPYGFRQINPNNLHKIKAGKKGLVLLEVADQKDTSIRIDESDAD